MIDSNKNLVNRINSCDMDKITTLIDLQGCIISLDLNDFKLKLNKNETLRDNSLSKQSMGLLNDFKLRHKNDKQKFKLTDYVHSNDLCHLQKHLNDGTSKKKSQIKVY